MRTYFRSIFWGTMLAIMVPMHLYAACQIVGTTPDGGYAIVCDGPDTIGLSCGDGSDIITINTDVPVSKTDQQSTNSTATAAATTISATRQTRFPTRGCSSPSGGRATTLR